MSSWRSGKVVVLVACFYAWVRLGNTIPVRPGDLALCSNEQVSSLDKPNQALQRSVCRQDGRNFIVRKVAEKSKEEIALCRIQEREKLAAKLKVSACRSGLILKDKQSKSQGNGPGAGDTGDGGAITADRFSTTPPKSKKCKNKSPTCLNGKCTSFRAHLAKNKRANVTALQARLDIQPRLTLVQLKTSRTIYCFCKEDWAGRYCDRVANNGSCLNKSPTCRYGKCEKDNPKKGIVLPIKRCLCDKGWAGVRCDRECSPGTYGSYNMETETICDGVCGACATPPCDPKSGKCPSGKCQAGFISPMCKKEKLDRGPSRLQRFVTSMRIFFQGLFRGSRSELAGLDRDLKSYAKDSFEKNAALGDLPRDQIKVELLDTKTEDAARDGRRKRQAADRSSLDVNFSVEFPTPADTNLDLEESLTSALKQNSANFKTDVLPGAEIDVDSVGVRAVAKQDTTSDDNAVRLGIVTACAGALLVSAVIVLIAVVRKVTRGKRSERMRDGGRAHDDASVSVGGRERLRRTGSQSSRHSHRKSRHHEKQSRDHVNHVSET